MLTIRPDLRLYGKLAASAPSYVAGQVEVTSSCFQRCRACESWRDDLKGVIRGKWALSQLQALVQTLAEIPTFEHLSLTGGDPQDWPELPAFLDWFESPEARHPFALQVNTAMVKPGTAAWRNLDDVRVSLDAIQPGIYQRIRGDKETSPEQVIRNVEQLRHPRVQFNTMICPDNVHQIQSILSRCAMMTTKPRKVSFLAVIGDRYDRDPAFWSAYRGYAENFAGSFEGIETSFGESVWQVRQFLKSEEAKQVPCYSGAISFHIKANGDVYPCCLAGGEAIQTYDSLKLGNIFEIPLLQMMEEYVPGCHYGNPNMPCSEICQYKQLQINLAGQEAARTKLAMP